ncbi:pentapeptide repeat-containing protein [Streptomyces antarcticus]|uniref:pentapeptide repeat-containing protein n=1 Tax=Streptomyces antarcticus TaxID=2996458 RepID=UPI00226F6365|nr:MULTISPECIES: pentapeptide repeat-containing protein [unclassified Streptomyces]MCY0942215.1 pentapeptide repeat-containing protein [Streptomyces sp. H34-AA3]MCZ4083195.1 pentapeptide repeat-containing protein [Streptomyces sp. H34-S5]
MTAVLPRKPVAPRHKLTLTAARIPDDDLTDDAMIRGVAYDGEVFAGQNVECAEVEQSGFENCRFTGLRTRQVIFSDTSFGTCDFAQIRAEDTSLVRATVTSSRITGASWSKSHFADVTFEACRSDMSLWRHSKFKGVVFTGCNLVQADFQFAEMRDVLFTGCDLTGAQFAHLKAQRVRFEECTLIDVGGAEHLKGATVQGPGAMELALALARDAGIKIEP